jgi:hypothetical protein
MPYSLPDPSYMWRETSQFHTAKVMDREWRLYCDGLTVRDIFGSPITFATPLDAKVYARDHLQFNKLVLTLS